MPVQIQIDQPGLSPPLPPGMPGRAREDLALGTPVLLSAVGGPFAKYTWRILHLPIDITANTRATSVIASPNGSSTTLGPLDVAGTYHVEVVVDSGSGLGALAGDTARITFYAGPPLAADPGELPRRVPAFAETTEHNVADAIETGGNTEGWAREMYRWFAVIERGGKGQSAAWGRVSVAQGGPPVLIDGVNIASVSYVAFGTYDIVFDKPLGNANYAVIAVARDTPGGSCAVCNETTTGFRIERADFGGGLVNADFVFHVLVGK